jgi:hypothetical protein
MEIVNMTNDTFYINFDYKGIPLDIPITKIEINLKLQNVNDNTIDLDKINIPTPTISKEREELNDTGEQFDEETPEFSREKVVVDETYGEVDVDDDNEEYGYPDKEEQPKKMTRDVLDRWIKEGDKILMSKDIDLQDIDEIQKVDRNKYRYDQETQLNDLMNDLLTSVSVEKQTPDFINQVHTLVERYKQLINEPVIENKTKPLVDNLQLLNKELTKKFKNIMDNEWLKENKYQDFTYYNIYLLLITILKNLFDINLFIKKEIQINKVKHIYHILDENVLLEHTSIMKKFNNSYLFNDLI